MSTARRWRDLIALLSREVTDEGELSTQQMLLVRQAALLALRIEQLQADAVSGVDVSDDNLVRLSNALSRLLTALAKQRSGKPRCALPTIAQHFEAKRRAGAG